MINIYNYLNFREFLHDFYEGKKRENPGYSYQVLANRAGFKSKSFVAHVIDGEKNLSEDSVAALAKAMGLDKRATEYFELLVAFNQAKSHTQKEHFFSELTTLNSRIKAKLILHGSYDFYTRWYHNTVRELVSFFDFKGDYSILARRLKPRITARQARQSVNLLLRLGLIRKEGDRYAQTDPDVTTGDTVQSLAVENFHFQNLNLAGTSIDTCPAQERDISCMVVGLSPEGFNRFKEEIRSFRKKLATLASADKGVNRVYHVAFQFFPTTEPAGLCEGGSDA